MLFRAGGDLCAGVKTSEGDTAAQPASEPPAANFPAETDDDLPPPPPLSDPDIDLDLVTSGPGSENQGKSDSKDLSSEKGTVH